MFAKRGDVQCIFVRGVGFGFSDGLRSAQNFLNGGLFIRLFGVFGFLTFFIFILRVVFFIHFVVLEDGAAGCRVGFYFLTDEILFGVDDAGREVGGFLIADGNLGRFR